MRDTPPLLPALAARDTLAALWRVASPAAGSALATLGGRWVALHEQHPRLPASHAQGLLACAFELQHTLCQDSGAAALCLLPGGLESALLAALVVAQGAAAPAAPVAGFPVRAPAGLAAMLARLPVSVQVRAADVAGVVTDGAPACAAALRLPVAAPHSARVGEEAGHAPPSVSIHTAEPPPGAALPVMAARDDLLCLDLAALPGLARETGPGLAALAASEALAPLLPVPLAACERGAYRWLYEDARPRSVGRLWADPPDARALLRAWVQLRLGAG